MIEYINQHHNTDTNQTTCDTEVTEEELIYAQMDEFGVLYSHDGKKLLNAEKDLVTYKVKSKTEIICDNAFIESSIQNVVLPNSLTIIGKSAFGYCKNLSSINLPISLTTIKDDAFYGCMSLNSLLIGKNVQFIGENPFEQTRINLICRSNRFEVIDNMLISDKGVLISCLSQKENVKLSTKIKKIGDRAFAFCMKPRFIIIPDSVVEIGEFAFDYCAFLKKIRIPKSVKKIGSNTFRFCNSLTEIIFFNEMTEIGTRMFIGCEALNTIILNENVKRIYFEAFCDCKSLHVINLPPNIELVDEKAFYGCTSLKYIEAPCKAASIHPEAFIGCPSLKGIYVIQQFDVYKRKFSQLESIIHFGQMGVKNYGSLYEFSY
jgi:hypothetical protein